MRIALVAQEASPLTQSADNEPASHETRVAALARELAKQDHRVTVYARKDSEELPRRAEIDGGVDVEHVPAGPPAKLRGEKLLPHLRAFAACLADLWRRQRPDVIHAVRWTSGLAALAGARELDIPVVQTFHSLRVAERRHQVGGDGAAGNGRDPRSKLEPAIARSASAVVATSSEEMSDLTSLGVPRTLISVVPFGVDTRYFAPDGPVARRNGRPRLLAVASPMERDEQSACDGLETVVRALRDIPDAELLIVGGAPRAELRRDKRCLGLARLANGIGVSDRVLFTGRVSHGSMPALLRSADLLVNVSWYEPFGMVSLEAMACGTPVVASAVGGHMDTVVDGTTGVLVPPGEPALLARRIRRLLASPMLLEGYGIAAADRARARYSWDRVSRETLAVYGGTRRPAAA
ncbi:MAG TPA: glycosyltransferase [Streptosporangiaceae bacterium]|nr:glycosyltransferase [Streptosporangiaceae bacterium]